jgi:hypothetical protein
MSMFAPSLLLDRKKLQPISVAALALRIAAMLALVGTVPALRAFARQYTIPERVIFFLVILGTLFCADTLLRRSRHPHALAVSVLALALNLINTALSLVTLGLPLLLTLSTIHAGTVACAPLATLVCAHPMIAALFLAAGGTLYVCAVLTSSLYFLSHVLWTRAHVRRTAAAGVAT